VILTVDLGTSATKVAVWGEHGLVALGRAPVASQILPGRRVEQDPGSWWASVVAATRQLGAGAPAALDGVEAVGFSAARQTLVPVAPDGTPLGTALVWSDRRAGAEAAALAAACGGAEAAHRRTGLVLDAAAPAAKLAWLAAHEPDRLRRARWILSPRDLVVLHLTGEARSDPTLASASGLYDTGASPMVDPDPELAGAGAGLLPEIVPSATVVGGLRPGPGADLGLAPGIPVVVGAGDRACEVLGTGARPDLPMVSWGTTANVSVPVGARPDPLPPAVVVTAGALGGWLLEGGLSAAGSALSWLAGLTGHPVEDLMARAATSPPGARGLVALPWFGGARAPWWRDGARGALVGLDLEHDAGDVARALMEAVAVDLCRCLAAAGVGVGTGPGRWGATGVVLGGGGSTDPAWLEVLTGVTGLGATRRRSGEAASAGAARVTAAALGRDLDLDLVDPVVEEVTPRPELVAAYRAGRGVADAAAGAVMGLTP